MTEKAQEKLDALPSPTGPLPSGRHNISPEALAENQRRRIIAAVARLAAEHGYADMTIRQIVEAASVSRRTVYEQFSGKDDAFLGAYRMLDDQLKTQMSDAAAAAGGDWGSEVAAALAEMTRLLSEQPDFARLYLVESAAAGEALVPARERTTARLIALLAPGREAALTPPAEGMEEAVVGGILVLLSRRVIAGEGAELVALTPAVVEFALSPYLGVEAARRTANRGYA